jgi:hypothetical protein
MLVVFLGSLFALLEEIMEQYSPGPYLPFRHQGPDILAIREEQTDFYQ